MSRRSGSVEEVGVDEMGSRQSGLTLFFSLIKDRPTNEHLP